MLVNAVRGTPTEALNDTKTFAETEAKIAPLEMKGMYPYEHMKN